MAYDTRILGTKLFAILWNHELMTKDGMIRIYRSRKNAELAIKRNWPGVEDYHIIRLVAMEIME